MILRYAFVEVKYSGTIQFFSLKFMLMFFCFLLKADNKKVLEKQ